MVLSAIVERLGRVWNFSVVRNGVRITYNPRLRSTLGRAFLDEKRIELNPHLLREHPRELLNVLGHELAHIVVYLRHGWVPQHGAHFRILMQAVNLAPHATHNLPSGHLRRRRRRYLYLHRCSDCRYQFVARKVRRDYYCATCGPGMKWKVLRVPNTTTGRKTMKSLLRGATSH
jgi:predicted SprT family Zn-dependent metalloprotease